MSDLAMVAHTGSIYCQVGIAQHLLAIAGAAMPGLELGIQPLVGGAGEPFVKLFKGERYRVDVIARSPGTGWLVQMHSMTPVMATAEDMHRWVRSEIGKGAPGEVVIESLFYTRTDTALPTR